MNGCPGYPTRFADFRRGLQRPLRLPITLVSFRSQSSRNTSRQFAPGQGRCVSSTTATMNTTIRPGAACRMPFRSGTRAPPPRGHGPMPPPPPSAYDTVTPFLFFTAGTLPPSCLSLGKYALLLCLCFQRMYQCQVVLVLVPGTPVLRSTGVYQKTEFSCSPLDY